MQFLDSAKIYIKSGDGGRGAIAFRREKFIEFGGPNGGNGGDGGDIYFEATTSLNTLIDFRYKQHFVIKKAESGKSKDKHGKDSEDLVIKIPIGTKVYNEDKTELLYDFTHNGEKILFLKGGMGGRGNASFKSSTNRAPRFAQPGMDGAELWVWLELEMLADFGIIGLPNAGKSTLINTLTSANAKTANYAFTTLQPNLGVLEIYDQQIVLADMPGLIEGASEGIGLGSKFLSHIKRCRSFIHLIDITSKDILKDIEIINYELDNYQEELLNKKQLVVLTKLDLISSNESEKIIKLITSSMKSRVLALSSLNKKGIDQLIDYLYNEYMVDDTKIVKKSWSPV